MTSKKQQFLQQEQNRDKQPEKMMKGSAAEQTMKPSRGQAKGNPVDHQVPGTGKVANDHNKQGDKAPTQVHQSQRTPESRHDRQNVAGANNEVTTRKGGGGGGREPRGAG
ncbi:hypothetical protein [Ramlibacter sp. Leaf400]|uniref:hypothetical protein n=1 Tax=Ramlibacter sp. Leaf400 TaxID=1736365 RepID=UPI001F18B1C6|nr:hypothetical protein [Ramlibacter sp. Leaf400]